MPYQYILANLLAEAENAVGVVFIDEEGETVDVAVRPGCEIDLRIMGAYMGIYLRRVVSLTDESGLGLARLLYVERSGLTLLGCALAAGYALGVVHESTQGVGRSSWSLLRAAEDLERTVLDEIE